MMNTFCILLVSHLLGDVAFSSQRLAILKRTSSFPSQCLGLLIHSAIHGFTAGVLLFAINFSWMKGAALVFFAHLLIDLIRSNTERRIFGEGKVHVKRSELIEWLSGKTTNPDKMNIKNLRVWILINILDQGCHMVSLYLISSTLIE
jgi:hypothetical protein